MPVNLQNAKHYTWGKGCEGWYLLQTPEITIIQERMPPGTAEIMHRHVKSRQFFYVLAGTAHMFHDGAMSELRGGDGLGIPPGVVHRISNDEVEPLEIIVTSQPPTHGDRIEENRE